MAEFSQVDFRMKLNARIIEQHMCQSHCFCVQAPWLPDFASATTFLFPILILLFPSLFSLLRLSYSGQCQGRRDFQTGLVTFNSPSRNRGLNFSSFFIENELKPKSSDVCSLDKKREQFNSTEYRKIHPKEPYLKATGLRPQDLAKNAQSFHIYSKDTDNYLKFITNTKYRYGSVITNDLYSSSTTQFALEDADADDTYYIKAMQHERDDDSGAVGYLYLSKSTSGVFTPLRKVMWSPNKEDDPKYKFKFEQFMERLAWYRIKCDGLYLTTGRSRIRGYVNAAPFHDDYECFFQFSMLVSIQYSNNV